MLTGLNQELIAKAIEGQLDATEKLVTWLVLVTIAMAWNAVQRARAFEVAGLKIKRANAMAVLAWVYALSSIGIAVFLIRIHELLRFAQGAGFKDAALILFTHSWLLNPFAYFGDDLFARLACASGFGLWAVIWWACLYSMRMLGEGADESGDEQVRVPLAIFLLSSGLIALVIVLIHSTLILRLYEVDRDLGRSLMWSGGLSILSVLVAWFLGKKAFESLSQARV